MNDNVKILINTIDQEIRKLSVGEHPPNLYEPIRYILQVGGKRIRPLLAILAFRLYHNEFMNILKPALAVEVFHNFTLLHDDIMDQAPIRRGKPTVHNQWNENVAILSGDVMLVRVYDLLLEVDDHLIRRVITDFNNCAAAVCEGQQLDMDFESLPIVTVKEYIQMIKYKTAVLLGFSLAFGGMLAGADESDIQLLKNLGINLGTGFQLMDDLLDVYAVHSKFGKQTGGDIITNKKTFLLIKARELAGREDAAVLENWISKEKFDPQEKIKAIRNIYDKLGIHDITTQQMNEYFALAMEDLEKISVKDDRKVDLRNVVDFLMNREI